MRQLFLPPCSSEWEHQTQILVGEEKCWGRDSKEWRVSWALNHHRSHLWIPVPNKSQPLKNWKTALMPNSPKFVSWGPLLKPEIPLPRYPYAQNHSTQFKLPPFLATKLIVMDLCPFFLYESNVALSLQFYCESYG